MSLSRFTSWVIVQLFLIEISSSITVHVNYTNNDVIDSPLPDDVNVTVTINDTTSVLLQLKRVRYVGLDTPVYTITTDKDGRLVRSREVLDSSENIGFYQDINSHASFEIERINNLAENEFHFAVRGEFVHAGQKYSLSPSTRVERDLTSQDDQYDLQLEKLPSHFQMDSLYPENPDGWPYDTLSPKLQARRRRQAKVDYYIDVTAMLDFMCWRRFLSKAAGSRPSAINNVLEYYAYIFNGVDLLFKSITSAGFKLNIRLTKIIICETAQSSPFTNTATTLAQNYIDVYSTIDKLKSFINIYGPNYLAPFEHVMLFVGCNLTNPDRSENLLGLAYVGTACSTSGESSSVIEDMGDYRCITTAAHELGHSLSASHDGEGNTCSYNDRYIMASSGSSETPTTKFNPWKFSNCSVSYFTTYVNTLLKTGTGVDCLTTQLAKDPQIPEVGGRLPGQMYSPTQQCVMTYGEGSYDCRLTNASDYCRKMFCFDPATTNTCYRIQALDGTTCGSGKLCRSGDCVEDFAAPVVDGECVFGDETGGPLANLSCASRIQFFPGYCYDSFYKSFCCASCKKIYSNITGCEYGDRYSYCNAALCSRYPVSSQQGCCKTCNYGVSTATTPTTTTSITTTPTTTLPTTTLPTTTTPTTTRPTTTRPTTALPTTTTPTTTKSTTTTPTTTLPTTTTPTTTKPTTTTPTTTTPTATRPTTTKSTTFTPTTTTPTTTLPTTALPTTTLPTTSQPTTTKPATTTPLTTTPITTTPTTTTPTTTLPTTTRPKTSSLTTTVEIKTTSSKTLTETAYTKNTTTTTTTKTISTTPKSTTISQITAKPTTIPTTKSQTTAKSTTKPTTKSQTTAKPTAKPTTKSQTTK